MQEQRSSRGFWNATLSRRKALVTAAAATIGGAALRPLSSVSAKPTVAPFVPFPQTYSAIVYAEAIAAAFYFTGASSPYVVGDTLLAGPSRTFVNPSGPYFYDPFGNGFSNPENVDWFEDLAYDHFDNLFGFENWGETWYDLVLHSGMLPPQSYAPDVIQSLGSRIPYLYFPGSAFTSLTGFLTTAAQIEHLVVSVYLRAVKDTTQWLGALVMQNPSLLTHTGLPLGETEPLFTVELIQLFSAYAAASQQHLAVLRQIAGSMPINNVNYEMDTAGTPVGNIALSPFSGPLAPYTTAGVGKQPVLTGTALEGAYIIWDD